MPKRRPLEERFWEKVHRGDLCWEWQGSIKQNGYGHIGIGVGKKTEYVHRVAWWLYYGVEPTENVLHHCDNRRCVRKNHLYEGSQKDNIRDSLARRRLPIGERHHNAKITDSQVKEIRERFNNGEPRADIASAYGINRRYVYEICTENRRSEII